MKHQQYKKGFQFIHEPVEFNKNSEKEFLQYCLGATLYMPGTKNFTQAILNKSLPGLTSMVMCFEDAIAQESLLEAEENVLNVLDDISKAISTGAISKNDIPLIFLRVRNISQFQVFSERLNEKHLCALTGFVLPKFNSNNGYAYMNHLDNLNKGFRDTMYAMPIIEGREVALKESRMNELSGLRKLLQPYRELILNIRVGATDLSSIFGVRRGINYSIYDILTVKDCISDILNFLGRDGDNYVLSAPVWEYFLASKNMKFREIIDTNIHNSLINRSPIIDEAVDGLLREVILDKANGFVGKTVIHPTHIKYVNAMQAVTIEEYDDAAQILQTSGGVIKSAKSNKMNEVNPHRSWAKRIYFRAQAYGVIETEREYVDLFN